MHIDDENERVFIPVLFLNAFELMLMTFDGITTLVILLLVKVLFVPSPIIFTLSV